MFLDVSEPALFVFDPNSAQAVAQGIAAKIEVLASRGIVTLSLNTRRLATSNNLRYRGSVIVSYTIAVPPAEHLTDANGNHLTVSSISEQMTAVVNDPVVRHSFGRKINEQFQSGAYSVTITGATVPTVGTRYVSTSTMAPSKPTSVPIKPGEDSFAHKQAVIGTLHTFGIVIVALSWLTQ